MSAISPQGVPSGATLSEHLEWSSSGAGGYGEEELERAGAYRVYADPADLLHRLYEVGVRVGAE
jgi:hypothetical protein